MGQSFKVLKLSSISGDRCETAFVAQELFTFSTLQGKSPLELDDFLNKAAEQLNLNYSRVNEFSVLVEYQDHLPNQACFMLESDFYGRFGVAPIPTECLKILNQTLGATLEPLTKACYETEWLLDVSDIESWEFRY